ARGFQERQALREKARTAMFGLRSQIVGILWVNQPELRCVCLCLPISRCARIVRRIVMSHKDCSCPHLALCANCEFSSRAFGISPDARISRCARIVRPLIVWVVTPY